MYNKIILVGNLTRDVELRYSPAGMAIAKIGLATSRKFTSNGEKKEEVMFVDVTFFGRSAEVCNQYLRKGSKILVEGRLQFDQWVDQNGGKRSKHSVTAESMQMLGNKNDAPAQAQHPPHQVPVHQESIPHPDYPASHHQKAQERNNDVRQHQQEARKPSMDQELPSIDIDEDEIPF